MSDGKDVSFVSHALADTLRTDLDDLNKMLHSLLGEVNGVKRETGRESLIAAMNELDMDLRTLSETVERMKAKFELAKCCL
ncbi:MAG: hypothetical protein OXC91_06845 [Rhodobacteraceae bacterium]|nr:hypothetical protein [Paracoccaceae bacterium]